MINKDTLQKYLPDYESDAKRQQSESRTLLGHTIFSEAANKLWIEMAYDETAIMQVTSEPLEKRRETADEIRRQRLSLERVIHRLDDYCKELESDVAEEPEDEIDEVEDDDEYIYNPEDFMNSD